MRLLRALAAIMTLALSLVLTLALSGGAQAEPFPYPLFKPSTLALVDADVAANNPKLPGLSNILFSDAPKLRLIATYVGEHRPITAKESDFIVKFAKSLGADVSAYAPLFKECFAFEDAGRRYWLPVQAPVAEFFAKELNRGQRLALYVVSAGGIAEKDQAAQSVLLVEEFDADPATTH